MNIYDWSVLHSSEAWRISSGETMPGGGGVWRGSREASLAGVTISEPASFSLFTAPYFYFSRCVFLVLDPTTAALNANLIKTGVNTGVGEAVFEMGQEDSG